MGGVRHTFVDATVFDEVFLSVIFCDFLEAFPVGTQEQENMKQEVHKAFPLIYSIMNKNKLWMIFIRK